MDKKDLFMQWLTEKKAVSVESAEVFIHSLEVAGAYYSQRFDAPRLLDVNTLDDLRLARDRLADDVSQWNSDWFIPLLSALHCYTLFLLDQEEMTDKKPQEAIRDDALQITGTVSEKTDETTPAEISPEADNENPKAVITPEDGTDDGKQEEYTIPNVPIERLGLSVRAMNVLGSNHIYTSLEMAEALKDTESMKHWYQMGTKTLEEIQQTLENLKNGRIHVPVSAPENKKIQCLDFQ